MGWEEGVSEPPTPPCLREALAPPHPAYIPKKALYISCRSQLMSFLLFLHNFSLELRIFFYMTYEILKSFHKFLPSQIDFLYPMYLHILRGFLQLHILLVESRYIKKVLLISFGIESSNLSFIMKFYNIKIYIL